MQFLRKSRLYYYGVLDETEQIPAGLLDCRKHPDTGLTEVRFPAKAYGSWADCEQRFDRLSRVKSFDRLAGIQKQFSVHTKSVEIGDEDWDAMCKLMVNASSFDRKDFRVYEAWLCHNVVDRDGERFSKDVLQSFEKTIIGKAVLTGHDWEGTGEGRYFKSRLQKVGIDEMMNLAGPHCSADLKEQYKQISEKDNGLYWLVASYYLLADDVEKIRKIDSGIISDMSIGFRAPELAPVKSGNGDKILWWEYRNTENRQAEALEGSHVFLGAQYGARTRKSIAAKRDAERTPDKGAQMKDPERQLLVNEAVKFGCLAGEIKDNPDCIEAEKQNLELLSLEELKILVSDSRKAFDEKHPHQQILTEDLREFKQNDTDLAQKHSRSFRAPVSIQS